MTTVAVLHPGSMGAAVGRAALKNVAEVLWCPAGRSAVTARRAHEAGFTPVASPGEMLSRTDIVLSICPPGQAADAVATLTAEASFRGIFVEANAISPQHALRLTDRLTAAGARFVDGAIIGYPPGEEPQTTLYLAGDPGDVAPVERVFDGTGCVPHRLDGPIGTASALKCAFSSYQKAVHALAGVAYALADAHGVREELMAEAERRAPGSPLGSPERLAQGAAKAWRWKPEFLEIVDALAAAGLPPGPSHGVVRVLDAWTAFKDDTSIGLPTLLTALQDRVDQVD